MPAWHLRRTNARTVRNRILQACGALRRCWRSPPCSSSRRSSASSWEISATGDSTPHPGSRSRDSCSGSSPRAVRSGSSTRSISKHRSAEPQRPLRGARAATTMGLEFLARVRNTSTWLGGVIAIMAATYVSPLLGLAFAAGASWSLLNLQLLERLVVTLTGPSRGTPEATRRAGFTLIGTLLLFAAGGMLLVLLSPPA